jgi:predicted CXXCH cytochrome family protein
MVLMDQQLSSERKGGANTSFHVNKKSFHLSLKEVDAMKVRRVLLVILMLGVSGYAYGQFAGDGPKGTVVGSLHDLRSVSTGGTVVCEYCHSPHKTTAVTPEPPLLWNVTLKAGPYAPYAGSSTFNATDIRDVSTASSANSAAYMSLLCLSCHDGAISLASFYRQWGELGTAVSVTPPNIGDSAGSGLSNDHPVDFTYSVALALADTGLKSPTEGIGLRIPYVGTTPLPLFKDLPGSSTGRLECATCHNPHKFGAGDFLRMDNAGSALCLNCHG